MMKKLLIVLAAFFILVGFSTGAMAAPVKIGILDYSYGNAIANANRMVTIGLASSSTVLSEATFDSMSVDALRSNYDVLIFGWVSGGAGTVNADWNTRLLPYLNLGGGVIWEDPNAIADLASSGINLLPGYNSVGYSGGPYLNDLASGGAAEIWHPHYGITGYSSAWDQLSHDTFGRTYSVYGDFGGRMILSVNDSWYHTPVYDNAYFQFLKNEITWVSSGAPVPEPATMLLLGSGLVGLAGFGRKKFLRKG